MNAIDSFPAADDVTRTKLPKFSVETQDNLIYWGLCQSGSLPWLMHRADFLWRKFPGFGDEHHLRIEATAALDLRRHRLDAPDDRTAVQDLNDHLWKGEVTA